MWRTHSGRDTVLALVLVAAVTSEGRSQVSGQDPTAAQVARALRTKGHPAQARAVLTQARGTRSAHQMDEVADTLVSIAATLPGDDLDGTSTRFAALSALVDAGRGSSGIDDEGKGAVRYAGAAARLMRLAETAQDVGIRAAAVLGLVQLPDSVRYFPFLRKVAASQDRVAKVAVTLLVFDTGPAGRAIARELYLAGSASDSIARTALAGAAREFAWRRP